MAARRLDRSAPQPKPLTLTFWRLTGFGDFCKKKNSSFRLPYQRPSSSADCARQLFNSSNGSASLVDCNRKKFKFFTWGVRVFVSDVISGGLLGHLAWPWAPTRAGLKGRGARGNFYWRAPMTQFVTSLFIKDMFSLICKVLVCFFR